MSKTTFFVFSLLTITVLGPHAGTIHAVETITSAVMKRNETIRENNQEFRGEVKDTLRSATEPGEMRGVVKSLNKERIASNSAARQLYRSERAQNHGERIEKRFAFYEERLRNIAARIQIRITTEKTAGKDTSAAQAALDKANTLLTQAVADGKLAVGMFQNISVAVWSTQAPEVKAAIEQANKARSGFVQVRLALIDATSAL